MIKHFIFSIPFYSIIIINLFSLGSYAQTPLLQAIRGTITDALTGQALEGASVLLPGTEPIKGTTTDAKGQYRLESVPVGRYQIEATYLGYEKIIIPEVLVESGKEVILNIALHEQVESLGEVVVKSSGKYTTALSPVSVRSIIVEEVQRFPATFNDPARLAMVYPGVTNTNDQANHISVRGNSPNSTSWRLEGAEIVNPNHLGDAGTFSNRPSQSGGGVNILSSQLLGTSNFYSSAFPVQYGNALGGVMDMRFRNGNEEKQEYTLQAGLIGFDFSAEGPLSKNKGISYLVNYRYSFVGLLSAMGVDFGGESISFQDLAFNIKAPAGKNGVLKIFGMGGISENIFTGKQNAVEWEIDKDRYNIDFTNQMGAFGASYSSTLGNRTSLKIAAVTSAVTTNKRNDVIFENGEIATSWFYDSITYRKVALHTDLVYKLHKKHYLKVGLSAVEHFFDISTQNYLDRSFGRGGGWLLSSYLQWAWTPIRPIKIQVGLHQTHFTYTNSNSTEPRASINWQTSAKNRFSLAYGLHSQIQPGQVYLVFSDPMHPNEKLDLTKSHHLVLGYTRQLSTQSELSAEVYYQSLFNVPAYVGFSGTGSNFSTINLLGDYKRLALVNEGTGKNYGLELTWQRFINDDYFLLANGSLYESKYTGTDGIERDTRFNGQFLVNLSGGKEFSWRKKGQQKILGVNARLTYAGGLRRTPIDEEASADSFLTTIEEGNKVFSEQQKDYFKIDFRLYLKNNKPKYNSMLALDLQNVSNTQNEAYYYYDHIQNRTRVQQQLGLIPNLSYRIEF